MSGHFDSYLQPVNRRLMELRWSQSLSQGISILTHEEHDDEYTPWLFQSPKSRVFVAGQSGHFDSYLLLPFDFYLPEYKFQSPRSRVFVAGSSPLRAFGDDVGAF